MRSLPNVANIAALIGEPTRAAMLAALVDGRALPANELGYAAGGISAQAASAHLAKLLAGGLLSVEQEGRHRYFRLASPQVAEALEALAGLVPQSPSLRRLSPEAARLRHARTCYDHLAGEAGVAVMAALIGRRLIRAGDDKRVTVTRNGRVWFSDFGIDVDALRPGRYGVARACLDWTERRHHLAGSLGTSLLVRLVDLRWLRREPASRTVRITPSGRHELERRLGIVLPA
jgi:DNA-binding transcriptional ArsR family regulator